MERRGVSWTCVVLCLPFVLAGVALTAAPSHAVSWHTMWMLVPPGLTQEWAARTRGSGPIPLADLAALADSLNIEQLAALPRQVPGLAELPLFELRVYGRLPSDRQDVLRRGEAVPVADLPADRRQVVLRQARLTHPWFEQVDLAAAVLRLEPQTLCTGEPGVALLLEYHFPAIPQDRDIAFVLPLGWQPHPTSLPGRELSAPPSRPTDTDDAAQPGPPQEE